MHTIPKTPFHQIVPMPISADDVVATSTLPGTQYDRVAQAWVVPDDEWHEFRRLVLKPRRGREEDRAVERFTPFWRLTFAAALAALVIGGSLLLSGCSGARPHELQHLRDMGATSGQVEGYSDGCLSGQAAEGYVYARFVKDFARYEVDEQYQDGWDQGYDFCAKRMRGITGRI